MKDQEFAHILANTVARHNRGELRFAGDVYRQLLVLRPGMASLLALYGVVLNQLENRHQAIRMLERSLRANPHHAATHSNYGNIQKDLGNEMAARLAYERAFALDPGFFEPYMNLGMLLSSADEETEGNDPLWFLEVAMKVAPHSEQVRRSCAAFFLKVGQHLQAKIAAMVAIILKPGEGESWTALGVVEADLESHFHALNCHQRARILEPKNHRSITYVASAFRALGRLPEAKTKIQSALTLSPDSARALMCQGDILRDRYEFTKSLKAYDRAILLVAGNDQITQKSPDLSGHPLSARRKLAEILVMKGFALSEEHRFDEALGLYSSALRIVNQIDEPNWNAALIHLLRGEYAQGWTLFERRFYLKEPVATLRQYPQPRWLGQDVAGKAILIYPEQGLGDQIQFGRYARLLADQGASVILEVRASLVSIFKTMDPRVKVIAEGEPNLPFDYHTPVMSLPMIFGTRLDTIPRFASYLKPTGSFQPNTISQIRKRGQPLIGLVWSGSQTHKNDANRSIPLSRLSELFALPAQFICLQKEIRERDSVILKSFENLHVFSDQLRDFADTANLIKGLDLVITVDTSVAHLAGALGKSIWIMLPFTPDFRWLLERQDSPWYPDAKLYRQDNSREWGPVIHQLRASLMDQFAL